MKNNKLFSVPMFMENIRRYWVISLCLTMLYLVSGPMLIPLNDYDVYLVRNVLNELNPGFLLLQLALPLWAAVCVYSYLHKTPSTGVMHSMPFSRGELFTTSYVSGLVLALAPVAVAALYMLAIKQPVFVTETIYSESSLYPDIVNTGEDLFTAGAVLRFAGRNMLVIAYSYTISALAAVICGNSLIHFLTACGLNLLAPALALLAMLYCDCYLYGIDGSKLLGDMCLRLHPYLNVLENGGNFENNASIAAYVAVIVLVFAAAYVLYQRRPMEKAGDSYVFDLAGKIIGVLIVLFAASLFGMLFMDIMGNLGYFIGGAVSFVIAQMIIRRSTRIFDKESLKPLIICTLCMVLAAGSFMGDWLGLERKVPSADSVKSAYLDYYSFYGDGAINIKDRSNIENLTAAHREILDYSGEFRDYRYAGFDEEKGWTYVTIEYVLTDNLSMHREYNVPVDLCNKSENLRAIMLSEEGRYYTDDLAAMDVDDLVINFETYGYALTFEDRYVDVYSLDYGEYESANANRLYGLDLSNIDSSLKQKLIRAVIDDIAELPQRRCSSLGEGVEACGNLMLMYTHRGEAESFETRPRREGSYWSHISKGNSGVITEEYNYTITTEWPKTLEVLGQIAVELSVRQ